jgi:hypothetical protein
MHAITSDNEHLQILGFVDKNDYDNKKILDDFNHKELRVLAVSYNEKLKDRCELTSIRPNNIKVVSDSPASQDLSKNQFKITAEILNKLLSDCDLLSSIEEETEGAT